MKTNIDVLLGNLDHLLEEENKMNKYFNMTGEFMIRWGWKVLDAEAKKAMLKELTPKKSRARKQADKLGLSGKAVDELVKAFDELKASGIKGEWNG